MGQLKWARVLIKTRGREVGEVPIILKNVVIILIYPKMRFYNFEVEGLISKLRVKILLDC